MSIVSTSRTIIVAASVALSVAAMAGVAERAAADAASIGSPIGRSWLATSYAAGGNAIATAIVTFQGDGRVTVSPVSGLIPQSTGDWTGGNGEFVHTAYAFRSGPNGALELERTRSVLQFDTRTDSWVTKESYSQFLDPTTLRVIAAQPGLLMRAVPLDGASTAPR
jgi:hypothetical protein